MYTILLVEDEENLRHIIKNRTPWEEHGFIVTEEASNGREGLELLEDDVPDVIITDIKMPYMDGIEFIENVRSRFSASVEVIILSGYDEFQYAQEAVRLNVAEYVLKPVTIESLCALLDRTKERIEKEKAKYLDKEHLTEVYKEALSTYRNKFLQSVIFPSKKVEELTLIQSARDYSFDFTSTTMYMIAVIEDKMSLESSLALTEINNDVFLKEKEPPLIFNNNNQFIYIFTSTMNPEYVAVFKKQVLKQINILKDKTEHILSKTFNIGISTMVTRLVDLHGAYIKAMEALNYSETTEDQHIVMYQDIAITEDDKPEKNYAELRTELTLAIKFATEKEVIGATDAFFENITNFEVLQATVLFFITIIIDICHSYAKRFTYLLEPNTDIFSEIEKLRSLSSATTFCETLAIKANKMAAGIRETSHIKFVEAAKIIIMKKYSNPLFGLDELCEEISVSPAYFSTTFKKETGTSFVQYLTSTRIEKAKELLKNSDLKTYEIAEKVGFAEPNYFSFTFRKNTGLSPSQYKQQNKI